MPKAINKISAFFGILFLVLLSSQCQKEKSQLDKIYQSYHQALLNGDAEGVKKFLSEEQKGKVSSGNESTALEAIKQFLLTDIVLAKRTISGKSAILEIEGNLNGQKVKGRVQFVKEKDGWKINKEDWEMAVEATGSVGEEPDVQPFLEDPQEPPQPVQVLIGHQAEVSQLSFTPEGLYLVSASYSDFSLRVWDVETGEEISSVQTENRVSGLQVSADGEKIYTADAYDSILVYPLHEGQIGEAQIILSDAGDSLALKPDLKYLAYAGFKKPVKIWDIERRSMMRTFEDNFNPRVLKFSPSGKILAGGGDGPFVAIWDTDNWKKKVFNLSRVTEESQTSSLDISANEKYLATGYNDSNIVIFNLQEKQEVDNWFVRDAATRAVQFSPDSILLATCHQDKGIYLWETETGKLLAKLEGHSEPAISLAFSPDGKTLASGGEDGRIIIWRAGQDAVRVEIPAAGQKESLEEESTIDKEPETVEVYGKKNLVKNPKANQGHQFWKTKGEVSVEKNAESSPFFVIRYSGMFWQDVELSDSEGLYALLIARSSSERVERDGDQTGLPYLYGEMLNLYDNQKINEFLSSENMLHQSKIPGEWGIIWGVFKVPPETGSIRLFLKQADGRKPQNGSAACFSHVGAFIFETESEAEIFVHLYERIVKEGKS